jgi:predicted ATP-grasp superfamily ATP-dependent carboligase
MLLICLLLPLMASLYFDTLTIQKKAERIETRIEKLLKNLEEKDKK